VRSITELHEGALDSMNSPNNPPSARRMPSQLQPRRYFLRYVVSGTTAEIALGWLFPLRSDSKDLDLETLCSAFPENSRCRDYLPGTAAVDSAGNIIAADQLLSQVKPGQPYAVRGLPKTDPTYLVITTAPKIAPYALKPVCTHLGCTVEWKADKNLFVCPCHGSQFDAVGRAVQGPAKRSLPLATVIVKQNQIRLVDRAPAKEPRESIRSDRRRRSTGPR
jgi:cytochrome b6-f complex iron-sulfur subunit